jgi:uncharacterized membrane protein YtjA (UPF0391 family)
MLIPQAVAGDQTGHKMLHYAAVFFVVAIIAAVLGFTGIAVGAASIARVLFFLFLIGAVVALLVGGFGRA